MGDNKACKIIEKGDVDIRLLHRLVLKLKNVKTCSKFEENFEFCWVSLQYMITFIGNS